MKLIRCTRCGDNVALSLKWRSCDCRASGGAYKEDLHAATVAGPCIVLGVENRVVREGRAQAWIYDESNGRIERLDQNPDGEDEWQYTEEPVRGGLHIGPVDRTERGGAE